jgi:ribonuclease-3
VIGALLIDQGVATTKDFILRLFSQSFQQATEEELTDYKSRLQELVQAKRQERPLYRLVKTEGPDHDRRFWVEVVAGGEVLGRGYGKSKQLAEKEAARQALENMSHSEAGNSSTETNP